MNKHSSNRILSMFAAFLMVAPAGCEKYETPATPDTQVKPKVELKTPASDSARTISGPGGQADPKSTANQADTAEVDADQQPKEAENDSAVTEAAESNRPEVVNELPMADGVVDIATDDLPTLDDALAANAANRRVESNTAEEEVHTIDIPATWKRLSPAHEIWVDMKNKQVIAGGHICLDAGPLEVFVCPRQTKEHESVVSIRATSQQVHAALLAIGAEPGKPVQWIDEYKPATGDIVSVTVMWREGEKTIERRGQEMILNTKTGKTMQHDWVFGGSIIETVEATEDTPAQSYYLADSGELICVSNFSTATLDVPIRSSDANEGLLFEANTENIPAVGTKVYVILTKKQ